MQYSKEALASLFYNVSASFQLLFLFFYFTSILLAKIFHFLGGNPFLQRNQDEYEYDLFSDEEEAEDDGYFHVEGTEKDHLVADIIRGGEALSFLPTTTFEEDQTFSEKDYFTHQPIFDECDDSFVIDHSSMYSTPVSESEIDAEEVVEEQLQTKESDTTNVFNTNNGETISSMNMDLNKNGLETHDEKCDNGKNKNLKAESKFTRDENFLIFAPPKRFEIQEKDDDEEIFGDSCTVGSTSKSSSEWRSSINYRDSGTEDPFSSSSRRSCPKWESYTVFQKYDEEMLFLDRISAQKLHETESLRSIQACPRSISERIVHKLVTKNKSSSSDLRQNPYHELEAAYVAQICLTWEALNWNYKYFQRLRASRSESDPGCPAHIAQQFQQFQVLLQRYIENEPYEHGRRPEIYARMRGLAPKLLQVPEYRDSVDEQKDGFQSRISSASFLLIMEEAIRTFMNFLKADRENHCQRFAAFFRKNKRGSVDPAILLLLKKVNNKKKLKLKDLRRARKCLRKRRLKEEEEKEILMGLIDLKVVSRVFRMNEIGEEQVQWCENKMSKVRVSDGKLQRDSSPLFFPAH